MEVQSQMIVTFEYGNCLDRMPLKAVGKVDGKKEYKGKEYWHVKPILWNQGSPLPRWVEAGSVPVINKETHAFPA